MRLLVVEDEPRLLHNLSKALCEQNYAVDTAADGEEGQYKALNNEYDAIILDVLLPKIDGWSILKRLRDSKSTPVLMLTALDAVDSRIKGLNCGADDYLVKPFDMGELFARLRALIRRSANLSASIIRVGIVAIDMGTRKVSKDGVDVPLTSREYALIEYLALHRGTVLSRSTLYEHLFDEHGDTLSNLIDVHMSNLRKKLGPNLITTRRGLGYSIEQ